MSSIIDEYFDCVQQLLKDLRQNETESIAQAAALLKRQIANGRLIHVFGVGGHSVIGSEEFFWRAGGLANVSPMFSGWCRTNGRSGQYDSGLRLHPMAGGRNCSTMRRR